jgi:hypothetical protein
MSNEPEEPCPVCGEIGDHADDCEEGIDTAIIMEIDQ